MWLALLGGYVVFSLVALALCRAAAVADRRNLESRRRVREVEAANLTPISKRPA